MSWDNQDKHLDVLQNIEFELVQLYNEFPILTDAMALMALKKAKIALKQKHGYGRGMNGEPDSEIEKKLNEKIISIGDERIGKINKLTLVDYERCIDQVCRSIERHRHHGIRGYFEFVKEYIK